MSVRDIIKSAKDGKISKTKKLTEKALELKALSILKKKKAELTKELFNGWK